VGAAVRLDHSLLGYHPAAYDARHSPHPAIRSIQDRGHRRSYRL